MKTVRIRKYIIQKKEIEEGEEFTVALEIKNSSGSKKSLEVRDFVPSVFTVKETEGLKPAKKKSHIGTELSWNVKDLNNHEERVLTYKIVPIFGVSGTIRLPRASIMFDVRGKKIEKRSFPHSVGIPDRKEDVW